MNSEISQQESKPWNKSGTYKSFKEADTARNKLLTLWSDYPDKYTGMQVKVRRMSGDVFVVKTRLHPDFDRPTKEKKTRGKNSRRNRKNSNSGKVDTP